MRFYRILLRLYPASFRAEYGEQLCVVLEERLRVAGGVWARVWCWIDTLLELPAGAAQVHWDILGQDVRYTARTLARSPGFTLTAILVTALGIGATTATFSITDHVLLRPLPFANSDQLVRLWESPPGYTQMELSPPNYRDWKQMSSSFESMGAYTGRAANLIGHREPQRVELTLVTSEVFGILGARPITGRRFTPEDDRDGAPGTVVLSYDFWQSYFGGGRVLGKKILLDGSPHTVIGVMPQSFHFPNRDALLWRPMQLGPADMEDRNNNELYAVARLKADVSLNQARSDMSRIAARLERAYPVENAQTGATVNLVRDEISSQSRLLLVVLLGASLCLLLIACTNVANLFLARALARRRELAVRTALGAGRERLTRQLLTESLCIAVLGGLLGALVALLGLSLLTRLVPSNLPIAQTPSLDLRVMGFAAMLTALTGIGFGIMPAFKVCRDTGAEGLREGARAGGGFKERLRSMLVIAEVSASVVLLVCAGLLLRALWQVQAVDPGFHRENVLTMRTALPLPKYATVTARHQFYSNVLTEVRALPGVSHAAYISYLPMVMRGGIWPVSLDGMPTDRAGTTTASLRYVTPGFLSALGIPVKMGRDVSESDTQQSPYVAVVSESFAQRFWPGQDPMARRFEFALAERAVVGVVGNIRVRGLERNSEPQVYLPYQQVPDGAILGYTPKDLLIRTAGSPERLMPEVHRIVRSADPEQPISDVRLLAEIVDQETASRQSQSRVIVAFAAAAVLLAGIGIHGLLAYTVSQRTQEIGVRIALGAQRHDIMGLVMWHGAMLACAGVLLGAGLAYVAGRSMEALLAGIRPADAITFSAAVGLSLLMTLAGSLLPALRAVRLDPTTAIRAE
ncbi:MAG: FtsX-like permease family protein [Luteitalea sp.]|nr:FtsX-like permease family protein [Luteitalea sp.]